jgi:hypothetical protein
VVAAWDVNLKANEKFGSTVNVNKKVDATVLSQFTAPVASSKPAGAATTAPTQAGQQGNAPGTRVGGVDIITMVIAIVVLAAIAAGIYFYIGKKK